MKIEPGHGFSYVTWLNKDGLSHVTCLSMGGRNHMELSQYRKLMKTFLADEDGSVMKTSWTIEQ
jgi:hypothetical protein